MIKKSLNTSQDASLTFISTRVDMKLYVRDPHVPNSVSSTERPEREQVMVAETEHGRFGFVVDQVLGDHQTVIKNLGRLYRNVQVVSGATILEDGTVALILDLHRLAQNVIRSSSINPRSQVRAPCRQGMV